MEGNVSAGSNAFVFGNASDPSLRVTAMKRSEETTMLHIPIPRWWQVCDTTPGSRVSALRPPDEPDEDEQPVVLPALGEVIGFDRHIRPLFRLTDWQAMRFAFDLWTYEEVSQHADVVLRRP
jgi:hypothetical protein